MAVLLRLLAAYTVLTALLVAVKFIFAVEQPTWDLINILMAAAIIVTVGAASYCKWGIERGDGGEADLRRSLDVNVPFYAAVALLIAFAFQWSVVLNDHVQGVALVDGVERSFGSLWAYIDTLFIVVTGMVGVRVWRAAGRRD